ncbi:MAG: hypothetical protein IIZ93_07900 [Acidaminococcaceae bacterium]|jgi:hypothetical protein|nr:hypothetical protein [Acidaminococcaceae bacterium]
MHRPGICFRFDEDREIKKKPSVSHIMTLSLFTRISGIMLPPTSDAREACDDPSFAAARLPEANDP